MLLIHTLLGTGLISAGASVLNHVLERDTDTLMQRTANRPLPTGRMNPDMALSFGVLLGILGLVDLAVAVNLLTALLGAVALAGYVFVYTPLKRISSLATVIGAVPGAIPPMMGWCAVRNEVDAAAWVLFGILFFWQLPHFLAIAWLCREDYARGGFPMLPVLDPEGFRTGRQAILYGAALVPVSLLPSLLGLNGRLRSRPVAQPARELGRGGTDLDHGVGRDLSAPGGGDDRVGEGRLVETVGAPPVRAQEREQPMHALVGVDLLDQAHVVAGQLELVGEASLDHVEGHRPGSYRGP